MEKYFPDFLASLAFADGVKLGYKLLKKENDGRITPIPSWDSGSEILHGVLSHKKYKIRDKINYMGTPMSPEYQRGAPEAKFRDITRIRISARSILQN